jgi:hypothetical protein
MESFRHPLTPPPTQGSIMLMNLEDFSPLVDTSEDSDYAVEKYLQCRCPKLDIKQFLSTYNRATIPIEEDFRLLKRLKTTLQEAPDDDADKLVMQVTKDLESERAESDKRCESSSPEYLIGSPFPPYIDGLWFALLRSKNLLAINDSISQLFPYLFERLNSNTSQPEVANKSVGPRAKKATRSFRVAKSKAQEKLERAQLVSPTKRRRLQDGTDTRFGKAQMAAPLRRSPRFIKN